jgi:uncharacterized protein (TIGR00661 family)
MARIIYGVNGTGHGHSIRALTIARYFRRHEFLFITWGDGLPLLSPHYPVIECPNPESLVHNHRIDLVGTMKSGLWSLAHQISLKRRVLEALERFQPDIAMNDYEFFLPRVCRQVGIPCLSMNHQIVVTCCSHPVPWSQLASYFTTSCLIKFLHSQASEFLAISFYRPPLRPGSRVKLLPPLLRESVLQHQPRTGEHIVAFQGYTTFKRFLPFLSAIPRTVKVYGFNSDHTEGNLHFKKFSEQGLLEDLSSCAYVICGGGHTLISEALYYGKPVLSFPVKNNFEQFLNAFYVEHLGYGCYSPSFKPHEQLIRAFDSDLERFRENIRRENFNGNSEIFALVDQFIRHKRLKPQEQPFKVRL